MSELICQGVTAINPIFDKHFNRTRKYNMYHPEYKVLEFLNRKIDECEYGELNYNFDDELNNDDSNHDIDSEFNFDFDFE